MDAWTILSPRLDEVRVAGPSGSVTGSELRGRVDRVAEALRSAGVRPRQAVAVVLPQDVDLVVSMLGIWALGAVPLPLDARLPRAELEGAIERSGAALAISGHLDLGIADGTPAPDGLSVRGHADGAARPDGEALLLGTSGTTGLPKIASVSARTIEVIRNRFPLGPDQTFLAALPLAHAYGLFVGLLAPLAIGAKVVLTDWSDLHSAIAFGVRHGASVMPAVPRMITQLLRADLRDLGTIRVVIVGGAPAPTADLVTLQERYGVLVGYGYGMTETAAVTTLNLHIAEKPGSVGRPFVGVEIRIASANGAALGPGETGEVWLRDTALASGYVGEGLVTSGDGWLRTGDLGSLDDEGYLTIVGRAKDIIITSGYNVVPAEVEDVLASYPGVEEAAVFGRAHSELGEEVVAVVVPLGGAALDLDDMREYARERLAQYKVPRTIRVERRELPRTLIGKLARWRLVREVT